MCQRVEARPRCPLPPRVVHSAPSCRQQKFDIATGETDQVKAAVEETKQVSEKLVDDLRALLEEADIKIAEISKDQYEFKRDVNAGAPGKPLADKLVHFLEDKLRGKDSVVDKLSMKNAALKQQARPPPAPRSARRLTDPAEAVD